MANKSISFVKITKAWTASTAGFTITGMGLMAIMDTWGGYRFSSGDYMFPVFASGALAALPVGLEGMIQVAERVGLARRFRRPAYGYASSHAGGIFPGHRSVTINGKLSGLFSRIHWGLQDNTRPDPDLQTTTYDHDKFTAKAQWSCFTSGSKKPVIIGEDYLYIFLKMAWERQQNPHTKNGALSRPYFTETIKYCSWPEYRCLIGLASPSIWGRGEGESGWLTVSPDRALARSKSTYPPFEAVRF